MRRYLIDLFDREDGAAADWQVIAETAFKVGLEAIDTAPQSARRIQMLRRLHEAAYDRLVDDAACATGTLVSSDLSMALQPPDPAIKLQPDRSTRHPG